MDQSYLEFRKLSPSKLLQNFHGLSKVNISSFTIRRLGALSIVLKHEVPIPRVALETAFLQKVTQQAAFQVLRSLHTSTTNVNEPIGALEAVGQRTLSHAPVTVLGRRLGQTESPLSAPASALGVVSSWVPSLANSAPGSLAEVEGAHAVVDGSGLADSLLLDVGGVAWFANAADLAVGEVNLAVLGSWRSDWGTLAEDDGSAPTGETDADFASHAVLSA
jgi:hypothetical protein